MVVEIRDLETADVPSKAARPGHLVLSTLHTNDAPTTLTRMRNMGIALNIASSVILITGAARSAPSVRAVQGASRHPPRNAHRGRVRRTRTGWQLDSIQARRLQRVPTTVTKGASASTVMPISEDCSASSWRTAARQVPNRREARTCDRCGNRACTRSGIGVTSLEEVLAVTNGERRAPRH